VLERAAAVSFLLLAGALPWTIAPLGITVALCAALTLALFAGGHRPVRTPVELAALAWAAALLLAALFAEDRTASLPRLSKALFPALVPLAAFHAAEPGRARRALAVVLASSALASLFGLAVFVARGASFAARARGPVGHYMTFAGQLLLFASLAAAVALLARERRWRIGALIAAAFAALALAATFTRSSWLGLAASLAVILALARPRWLPALGVAIAVLVLAAPGNFRARLVSVFDPNSVWNLERTYMWEAGGRIFRDHPLTGVGLQDLHAVYDRYRPPGAAEHAGHLHSVPVQIAASMGLAGLAAFAWLYGSLFVTAGRGVRTAVRARGLAAAVRLGVTAALVGFLVAGLFEWNFGDEELLYPLYVLVGLAFSARHWEAATVTPAPAAAAAARAVETGR